MESFAHLELKRLAVAWLKRLGCQAIATEVRCPISKYRVDVAGWLDHADGDLLDAGGLSGERPGIDATLFSPNDRSPRRRGPARPRTIVVECKQSRTDFTRDDRNADRLKSRLESLKRTRRRFEEDLIPRSEPHLRESGSSLFRELERWDFEGSRTTAYRRTLKTIERLERHIEDRLLVAMQRYAELEERLAETHRARDRAVGAEARTRAERAVGGAESELESCAETITALRERDDERYTLWRTQAHDKRYAVPRVERIIDVRFVVG